MVKKQQKNKSRDSEDGFRRLGVLIEHVDEKMRLIAEQHTGIRGDIRDIKKTQNSHTEMIGGLAVELEVVKSDLEIVKADVKTNKADLEIVKKDVKATKTDLEIVKSDVKKTKSDLDIVKTDVKSTKVDVEIIKTDIEFIKNSIKKKIDVDEFAVLERRVALLEKHR